MGKRTYLRQRDDVTKTGTVVIMAEDANLPVIHVRDGLGHWAGPGGGKHHTVATETMAERLLAAANTRLIFEGWWNPDVKSGQVHSHPEQPKGSWSVANHRSCEKVFRAPGLA